MVKLKVPRKTPALLDYLKANRLSFEAGFRHINAVLYCRFHSHKAFEIVYHARGRGRTALPQGDCIEFEEGSVVIYPPGVAHDQRGGPGADDFCIHFSAPAPWPEALAVCRYIPEISESHIRDELHALSGDSAPDTPEMKAYFDHRTTALVAGLLLPAAVPGGSAQRDNSGPYAEQAARLIRQRYRTLGRMEELAGEIGISSHYLRHLFKRKYGKSMKRYLVETQLARAKDLLLRTTFPLKAIADLSGFRNNRYLCTCFKMHAGASPGQYRRKVKIAMVD